MEIIIKNYEHFNKSLPNWDTPKGKYIRTKRQYIDELKRNGYVDAEKGEMLAETARKKLDKPYSLSKDARSLIASVKNSADRKGKVKLSDCQIDGMKSIGVKFDVQWCPEKYKPEGGFKNAE